MKVQKQLFQLDLKLANRKSCLLHKKHKETNHSQNKMLQSYKVLDLLSKREF
jgi:hypothetical protein